MDENADRAQVHGQQPVPERDIEPLWPPDPADRGTGNAVPPWAAGAQQPGAQQPGAPGPVTPPVDVPPFSRPPVPGQPGAPAQPPPSPSDYPSLSGAVPAPGGWGAGGPNAATSGWAPPQPGWPPPADSAAPPVPGLPPNPGTPAGPGTPVAPGTPEPSAPGAAGTAQPPVAPPIPPGGVDLNLPFTLDHSTAAPTPTDRPNGTTRTSADPPAAGPAAAGPAPQVDGAGGDGSVGGVGRPTESPWAYPPQRPASHDATATPPPPAPPVPQPPHPGPGPAYPAPPVIPGQAGPGYIPPPPDLTQFGNPPQQGGPVAPPPGPYPPSPGWYPPPWQQGAPGVQPGQPYPEADGVTRMPGTGYPDASPYPDASWASEDTAVPTAEDFSRRRQVRPADPMATMGVRAVVNKMGLLRLSPGRHEQELKRDIEMVRRNFGGLRQVTVVNPKGGAGKTVAILLLAMTFGQKRGGYVLAWDNNETQGTLGMRAQQDFHSRTVRDMLRDLGQFQGAHGRVGDLSQYVRSQGEGMFDVLASDESATGGEMLTAAAFAEIREVVSRFYKLIFVDTGNNVRAQNWQASMDATDQLVVTMSARNDSAETAARMLDHLEQSGRQRLVRQAVTVVSMPPSRKEIDLPAIQEHFAARTRAVLLAPYERLIDTGEPIRYGGLSAATRDAWLKIAASVAEGL
ncbi:chromosome partitioning protein [Micromonospora sp. NPDC048905]|uniref:MinD/ParA family ATP-binding protein n=1 Tax=Micromonospora sp. NPDC048905 TaxID=3155494 RepID=UPI0034006065